MIQFTAGLLVGFILALVAVAVGIVYQVIYKTFKLERKDEHADA